MSAETTCYEVAARVSETLRDKFPGQEFYVLGGVATGAIASHETVDVSEGIIEPTADSDLSTIRRNGSKRDIDLLVRTTDGALTVEMAEVATEAANDDMKVDVFGFDGYRFKRGVIRDMFGYWTSRREVKPGQLTVHHVLSPFSAQIPRSAFDAWLVTPKNMAAIPVMEPYYHLLSYDLRSIGGPRPKDQEKLAPVRDKAYEITEQSGTDMTHYESLEKMRDNLEAFRAQTLGQARDNREMILLLKSKIAAFGEDQEWLVDWFQKPEVQRIVRPFVGSKKA